MVSSLRPAALFPLISTLISPLRAPQSLIANSQETDRVSIAMSFPTNDGSLVPSETNHSSRERFAAALRRAVQRTASPVKVAARALDLTPKGAELLLRGDSAPSFETLIRACREFDECWDEVRAMFGRADEESDANRLLDELAAKLRERRGG
jgi:hypothetical protein